MSQYRDPWVKKAKWLTQALIISCTINVGLLSTFIYTAIREDKNELNSQNPLATNSKESLNLQETLNSYSSLSFQDLLLRLGNNQPVDSSCTRRDLALACLVAYHDFNLERALGGLTLRHREIRYTPPGGDPTTITIFPGLVDYQFQAIVHYAKTEKWPLTPKGLFTQLQKNRPPYDNTLLEALYLTPEFHFISLLFTKTGLNLKKESIAALISQSTWPTLQETSNHLKQSNEFTPHERRHFLLRLVEDHSKIAAKILLEIDQDYCLKSLSSEQILTLCNLLKDNTSTPFLKQLINTPRSEDVWKVAASLLYDQAAETAPETLNLENAQNRFIHLKAPKPVLAKARTYTVQPGDSLWKIAQRENTTVKALRETNSLTTDRLQVGQSLTIP